MTEVITSGNKRKVFFHDIARRFCQKSTMHIDIKGISFCNKIQTAYSKIGCLFYPTRSLGILQTIVLLKRRIQEEKEIQMAD